MGVIYVIIFIGLLILRVRYAWLIAFGIAFLDMLPVFGTGTVLCPWAVVKFFSGNYMTASSSAFLRTASLSVGKGSEKRTRGSFQKPPAFRRQKTKQRKAEA